MKIDSSLVEAYLAGKPSGEYREHWVYHEPEPGQHLFKEPPLERRDEVSSCHAQITKACSDFSFMNEDIVKNLFTSPIFNYLRYFSKKSIIVSLDS